MAADELIRIAALGRRPAIRAALGEALGIESWQQLVMTDRDAIVGALASQRIEVSLEEVAAWQDDARRLLARRTSSGGVWDQVGSFVVSFEQRLGPGGLEQQLVVVRTEDNGPSVTIRTAYPGWDLSAAWHWMRAALGEPEERA